MNEQNRTQRLDGLAAHRLDARSLLNLLPHVDQSDLHEIRKAFANFLDVAAYRRGRDGAYETWQAAWNDFIGPTRVIEYRTPRCKDCHHGMSHRNISHNLSRTGSPYVCGTCRGTGRGTTIRQQARRAPASASGLTG